MRTPPCTGCVLLCVTSMEDTTKAPTGVSCDHSISSSPCHYTVEYSAKGTICFYSIYEGVNFKNTCIVKLLIKTKYTCLILQALKNKS